MNFRFVEQVQIILSGRAKWAARWSNWRTGRLPFKAALKFVGPHFDLRKAADRSKATLQVAIGQSTINVVIDKTEYVYPLSTVGRAKIVNFR